MDDDFGAGLFMGAIIGIIGFILLLNGCDNTYSDGVRDVNVEAYRRGFMTVSIDKNKNVKYTWINEKDNKAESP